jgi:hypothetical protein
MTVASRATFAGQCDRAAVKDIRDQLLEMRRRSWLAKEDLVLQDGKIGARRQRKSAYHVEAIRRAKRAIFGPWHLRFGSGLTAVRVMGF